MLEWKNYITNGSWSLYDNMAMVATPLYKYFDFQGGLKMLENSNLQFTNATQ